MFEKSSDDIGPSGVGPFCGCNDTISGFLVLSPFLQIALLFRVLAQKV